MESARWKAQAKWLRAAKRQRGKFAAAPLPSVEEIRDQAARIRASWFDVELRQRMGLPPVTVSNATLEECDE